MKIKVAHEAPISILHDIAAITDYDYCLVHLLEKYPTYKKYFKTVNDREILLDNSIFELGVAFDTKKFVEAIEEIKPNFYIVPDVLENSLETMNSFTKFIKEYKNLPGLKIGAIQGGSYQDIRDCYSYMSDVADYIAISFDFTYYEWVGLGRTQLDRWCDGRQRLIENLISDGIWNWKKPHHLLGNSLMREMSWYTNNDIYNIRSVDTSNPVMAGLKGMRYNGNLGLQIKPEGKLADHIERVVTPDELRLINYNVYAFMEGLY